ncbi:MAG TPA: copper resistance protein CopC, partial [Acidimicrobiales bacterium]|nr:copper resistance protein CopC [Acidimicrobiales bacterium]
VRRPRRWWPWRWPWGRRWVGALAAFWLTTVALSVTAPPAGAHARLVSTRPADGDRFDRPPTSVVLRFSEPMELASGDVRVYDGTGSRVAHGPPRQPGGDRRTVSVDLPALGDGAHVVVWRMASADAHVVRGAFAFDIGPVPAARTDHLVRRLLSAQGENPVAGAMVVANRAVGFAALAVVVGGLGFLLWVWPAGQVEPRVRRTVIGALAVLGASTAAGMGLHGVAGRGLPAFDALRPTVVGHVLATRFGQLSAARLALVLVAAAALARGRPGPAPWRLAAAAASGMVATVTLSGHAASGRWVALALPADLIHLAALGLWLGGLVMLLACVLSRRGWPGAPAAARLAVAERFSSLAFASVAAVVVTGTVQAARQVASPAALTGTTYGRLLLAKVAVVAALVASGAASRSALRRRRAAVARAAPATATIPAGGGGTTGPAPAAAPLPAAGPQPTSHLRRLVAREVALAATVAVLAALLVSAVPARLAHGRPFSASIGAGPVVLDVTVDPAQAGPVDIHVYALSPEGRVTEVGGMTAELTLTAREVGPLPVPLRRAGPGHFAAYGFRVPYPGAWELSLVVEAGGTAAPASARVLVR